MIEIKIKMSNFDYESAIEEYLPIITQKVAGSEDAGFLAKIVDKNSSLSAKVAKAALSVLPQNKKDEIAVAIIEKYKDELEKSLLDFASEKSISFRLEEIQISSVE